MANAPVDIGTGATIGLSTSLIDSAELLDIQITQSRKAINVSHMGSSTWEEFIQGDIADPGQVVFQVHFDPDKHTTDPIVQTLETMTITFPNSDTLICDGYVTDVDISVPLEDKMVASYTFKLSGDGTTVVANNLRWTNA